eukprot:gene1171-67294_t
MCHTEEKQSTREQHAAALTDSPGVPVFKHQKWCHQRVRTFDDLLAADEQLRKEIGAFDAETADGMRRDYAADPEGVTSMLREEAAGKVAAAVAAAAGSPPSTPSRSVRSSLLPPQLDPGGPTGGAADDGAAVWAPPARPPPAGSP